MIDFEAVYDELAENEYEALFGGGSLFWRHFPVPEPENLIIFQENRQKFKITRKCSKIPLKLCIVGRDRRREAWGPENSATNPNHGFVLSPLALLPQLKTANSGRARVVLGNWPDLPQKPVLDRF